MVTANDGLDFDESPKTNEEKNGEEKKGAAPAFKSNSEVAKALIELRAELDAYKKAGASQVSAGGAMSNEQFAELVKVLKAKPASEMFGDGVYVDNADIPVEDYDELGATFSAYSSGMVIVDDIRKGAPVRTPRKNIIYFTHQGTSKHQNGKHVEVNMYSSYKSHSRVEQAWLREHKHFGVTFFDSAKSALSADYRKASKMIKTLASVNAMEQQQIFSSCKAHGVPVMDEVASMRVMLAQVIVDKEVELEKKTTAQALEASKEAESILAQKD